MSPSRRKMSVSLAVVLRGRRARDTNSANTSIQQPQDTEKYYAASRKIQAARFDLPSLNRAVQSRKRGGQTLVVSPHFTALARRICVQRLCRSAVRGMRQRQLLCNCTIVERHDVSSCKQLPHGIDRGTLTTGVKPPAV